MTEQPISYIAMPFNFESAGLQDVERMLQSFRKMITHELALAGYIDDVTFALGNTETGVMLYSLFTPKEGFNEDFARLLVFTYPSIIVCLNDVEFVNSSEETIYTKEEN